MNKLDYIKVKYSLEINEIQNDLKDLKEGKVYEISKVKGHGYINGKVEKLERKLNMLINMIVKNEDSALDKIFDTDRK